MTWNIGNISIDVGVLIAFLSGIFFCFIVLSLWYAISVLQPLHKPKRKAVQEADIDEKEIEWLIKDAHEAFKNKEKRDEVGFGKYLIQISTELSNDIATKFYPRSKYPYLELTIDETLDLLKYISDRFKEIMNKPFLKLFRGITLRQLMTLNETKEKIDNNPIVKTSNKLHLTKVFKNTMTVLNAVNPVYWFRKVVIDNVTNAVILKLGLVVISLTGEETYKIYSKKVFNEEREVDGGVNELYQAIEKEIKEENKLEEK
ncbi:hypothetical protein [Acholeplasma hippikon]|uniref:Uncharacterized protein n=1 Tax=Acholeplasma hippikon TaxID=264636 RepID=A0A449BJL2_9MOLU|nr:hypothetical protein [Acholeplasma hippikon]VEU82655.1 Uncharacterised protein [Acholeplasma hippikon]